MSDGSEFKETPKRFTTQEYPQTQYTKGINFYADRYGWNVSQAKNWRLACFSALACCAISCVGNIYLASLPDVVPYIVEVDGQSGALLRVTKSTDKQEPDEKQMAYFVWDIVKKSRTLTKDIKVYDENWNDVYKFLTDETAAKMNEMAVKSGHEEKFKNGVTTQLTIKSSMKTKEDTYQIRWHETEYSSNGKINKETDMEGLFTVKLTKPEEASIFVNPLGITITDFNWSQER